ncbi:MULTISPECIES: energy-coupled thiamine transporter ThiT [Clostridium]|uniref:Energy-coupled thiamine transporter ThiT n=1 Tax=Clostridium cibarium TaxID=2762247 RepID=A0ABR8PRX8_9CLOT|nr:MULTISPECIES: energy-coupled thiamine transporter ThiT [Clostridium]MBD7910934.1 energy-coupled thiamine transporter ThiT [Clostridium cibarium]
MNFLSDWSDRLRNYFTGFSDKSQTLINNPSLFIGLIGLAIIIVALIRFKKVKLDAKMISRIGIALALACVLQVFRIYHFPMGGSVTLGGMVPILLIAFIYGPEIGMLTGFLYGLLNLFLDPYFVHPVQILFDYPLPSLAIGLAGYLRDKPIPATIMAFVVKFVCHFISGVVFFSSDALSAGMHPWIYSAVVNGPMVAADAIICVIVIALLPLNIFLKEAKA